MPSNFIEASPATQNVKVGYLTKIGANVKNWKRRYFVAKNQSENFVVHYYESPNDLLKEKGSFNCCGYALHCLEYSIHLYIRFHTR